MVRPPTGRRTDLIDTSDWVHAELIRRLRAMTPQQRFMLAIESSELGRQIEEQRRKREADKKKGQG